ncbi:MAG: hypothetical protein ISP80_07390 [Synechococcus sp. BS301-5m-G53]|jgi:hypothetical protein|uniref:hypothetical protein n=1 Tax=unclassified Synechococcus TaxID=2626047 RepID=UPI00006BB305|nr:hypothetical protein [Synechococcus sp. WH 7805]EAR19810.1 hypothetical protein WH7805_12858 [Synechococcus sp. WH 7805]MBL6742249.1 hypothetical protein [Synechococcus sp. BS301-5m-G53]
MGFLPLSLTLLLAATPIAVQEPPLQDKAAPVLEQAMAPEAFEAVLLEGDIPALQLACADAVQFGLQERLRLLRNRLMEVAPAPQPFEVVMANAQALMQCKAPDSVPVVLARFGPAPGRQRREWLLLSWQAAAAAFDQDRAVLALMRLVEGDRSRLEEERLIVGLDDEGQPQTRSALDLLAEHQIANGQESEAVLTLLAARTPGVAAARRLGLASELLGALEPERSGPLLEAALDQAAAAQAWNLAEDLLRLQLALELENGGSGDRPRERLRRLATRVDDRFTLLDLDRESSDLGSEERQQLDQELRSPRAPGGHAALGESRPSEVEAAADPPQP